MYLVFKTEKKAEEALARINQNMGLPDAKGTETWAKIAKVHEQDLWFFVAPRSEYMNNVLFDEIVTDVSKFFPKQAKLWES